MREQALDVKITKGLVTCKL